MKRILMLSSVASMVNHFLIPHIELLIQLGYRVDVACNYEQGNTCTLSVVEALKTKLHTMGVGCYQIDFDRKVKNIKEHRRAYKQVKALVRKNHYDVLHCHSPIGGVIGRLVGKTTRTKVIYTAHGFHFHKAAPRKNWFVYYPIEKICSLMTDTLITINQEDYSLAKKKMWAKKIFYLPGIGVDFAANASVKNQREEIRKQIGVPKDAFLLISVGEVNHNKNHSTIIKAIQKIGKDNIHYVICGMGCLEKELRILTKKLGLEKQIHLLGFCDDIMELHSAADVFCFPSFREGLGVAALEAMSMGLPIITSNVHGINDYSIQDVTGLKTSPDDIDGFAKAIINLAEDAVLCTTMGENAKAKSKEFSLDIVLEKMKEIYSLYL